MSFSFHTDKPRYFEHQYLNAKNYIIPFINKTFEIKSTHKILEIGCAEGGVLKAFTEIGCQCTGVELSESKVINANTFMKNEVDNNLIKFINKNIYDFDFQSDFLHYFDIIILKDTIEHIHDQQKIITFLPQILKKQGVIFFGFPPWFMPWGGHQQICKSKVLCFMPYFHILPMFFYVLLLKLFGETTTKIADLKEIKQTAISTMQFEKYVKNAKLVINAKLLYFVNPIYFHKFGWKTRVQNKIISKIPVINDLLSTTAFYLVKNK